MSQNEEYLDNLLSSITQAKTTDSNNTVKVESNTSAVPEKKPGPEDDFFEAFGINPFTKFKSSSRNNLRKIFKEKDFLSDFENELEFGDADSFIDDFEQEIALDEEEFALSGHSSSEDFVKGLFDGDDEEGFIDITMAKEAIDEDVSLDSLFSVEDGEDDLPSVDDAAALDESDELTSIGDEVAGDGGEDDVTIPEESLDKEPLEKPEEEINDLSIAPEAMEEFGVDELDELGAADGELDLGLSGDLGEFDIGSILEGSDDSVGIDDIEEALVNKLDEVFDGGDGGKKKKPNAILTFISNFLFGKPDEDDAEEARYFEEQKVVKAKKKEEKAAAKAEADEKKKKESEAKAAAAKAEKAAKESKPKPAKPPKPKKEKKVDNSPKIPMKVIVVFMALAGSFLAITIIATSLLGTKYQLRIAQEIYRTGDYQTAYEACNGLNLKDEEDIRFRNGCRVLADLHSAAQEADLFYSREDYDMALDSLVLATGRYVKYKKQAVEYDVESQYNVLGNNIESKLMNWYGVTEDEALVIYGKPNRRRYTIELKKILIDKGYIKL